MGELIQIKEPRKLKTLLVKNKLFRFLFLNPLFCLYTKLTSQTQGSESVPPALSRGAWQCLGVAAFCRCAPPSLTFESLKSSSRCQDRVRSWSGLYLSDRKYPMVTQSVMQRQYECQPFVWIQKTILMVHVACPYTFLYKKIDHYLQSDTTGRPKKCESCLNDHLGCC